MKHQFSPYSYPGLNLSESSKELSVINYIKDLVCRTYKIKFDKVDIKCRKRKTIIVRQAIIYFLRTYTKISLKDIASEFTIYKEHTTIRHHAQEYSFIYVQDAISLKNHKIIDKRIKEFIK